MVRMRVLVFSVALVLAMVGAVPMALPADSPQLDTSSVECEYPFVIEDGTGTEVTIDEPPEDIVVMHASSAQVVHDIGGWDRVTGAPVAPFTAYLDDYDEPRDVTDDLGEPILEEIVNLSPDLVIAGHVGDPEKVSALRDEGITVYMGPAPTNVGEIAQKVELYGQLIGNCEEAQDRVEWMDDRLSQIDAIADEHDDPVVYFAMGDGWTAGDGTFQQDAIERAGGSNLGGLAGVQGWEPVNEEEILDLDPEWIIYDDVADEPPVSASIHETTAMERNQTLAVNSNYFNQAGPRIVLVMEEMATAFAETSQPEDVTTEDATDDDGEYTGDEEPTEPDDAPDDALVGFGVVAAGGAIVIATLLARRD